MRTAGAGIRSIWALLFALVLALRLLSPAGFMPAFEHGAVTIVMCPDADDGAAPAGHRHHNPKKLHQPCPYAAASSLGSLASGFALPPAMPAVGVAPLPGRAFSFVDQRRAHERPPLRGPPLPA